MTDNMTPELTLTPNEDAATATAAAVPELTMVVHQLVDDRGRRLYAVLGEPLVEYLLALFLLGAALASQYGLHLGLGLGGRGEVDP